MKIATELLESSAQTLRVLLSAVLNDDLVLEENLQGFENHGTYSRKRITVWSSSR